MFIKEAPTPVTTNVLRAMPCYKTNRLLLHPMTARHEQELVTLHKDNAVMQSIGEPYSAAKTHRKIKQSEAQWLQYGFGLWCWFLQSSNEFVGRGGMRYLSLDSGEQFIDLAYMVHKKFWGQGYATEVAQYCIELGFNTFNFNEITAVTRPENLVSQQIIRKIGMQFKYNPILFRGEPHLIASIKRYE